jgi:hypothetical protein
MFIDLSYCYQNSVLLNKIQLFLSFLQTMLMTYLGVYEAKEWLLKLIALSLSFLSLFTLQVNFN